jgi:putative addiction module CopG family antidote
MDITISLPRELIRFIKTKVASGRYSSTSEVVRDALLQVQKIDQRRRSLNLARHLAVLSQEQQEDLARREAIKERLTQDLIRKYGPPETKAKPHKKNAKARKKKA